MNFEFDQNKSKANKIKHGIDFIEAQKLWLDENRSLIQSKYTEEPRFLLIAKIKNHIGVAVFTFRNESIRIISVRKARENEKEIYYR
jgi:uncharacterized DUF497 family protein